MYVKIQSGKVQRRQRAHRMMVREGWCIFGIRGRPLFDRTQGRVLELVRTEHKTFNTFDATFCACKLSYFYDVEQRLSSRPVGHTHTAKPAHRKGYAKTEKTTTILEKKNI